jgi:hypothetical protein
LWHYFSRSESEEDEGRDMDGSTQAIDATVALLGGKIPFCFVIIVSIDRLILCDVWSGERRSAG